MEQPDDYPRWYRASLLLLWLLPISFMSGMKFGVWAKDSPAIQEWLYGWTPWPKPLYVLFIVQGILTVAVEIRRYRIVKARMANRTEL